MVDTESYHKHNNSSRPATPTSPFHDSALDDADNRIPLRSERVPVTELKYFTHNFANQGMGHKFSELVMGLYFAHKNGLQYVFNERAFVRNFRNADLQWLGDLLRQRYPVPPELREMMAENDRKAGIVKHHSQHPELEDFDMVLNQWIPVVNYRDTAQFHYNQLGDYALKKSSLLGFGGGNSYMCPEDNNPRPNPNCFLAGFSFFNASRDAQDLLQHRESTLQQKEHTIHQVDRFVIHIRLGDIQVSEKPETYVKVIEGMRRKLNITLPEERIHFVYFKPADWSWETTVHSFGNWKRLREIKSVLPKAQYHDIESTEETLRFMIGSKYLMTSGSSLSYVAAYFCPNCHVISVMPKEYIEYKIEMSEENYMKTFYYMDEWVPYIHYAN